MISQVVGPDSRQSDLRKERQARRDWSELSEEVRHPM